MGDDTFIDRLRADIEAEKQALIGVAEHRDQINDVNPTYKERRRTIRSALKKPVWKTRTTGTTYGSGTGSTTRAAVA